MTWAEPTQCRLCGHQEPRDIGFRLVHWKVAEPGMSYEHVSACRDYAACRVRVERAGRTWPLLETNERSVA